MTTGNSNGGTLKERLIFWTITAVITGATSLGGMSFNTAMNQGQRITVLETEAKSQENRLQRIENKLDSIAEHLARGK